MNIIVTVDKNWGIGYKGKPLVSIPSDMKTFRTMTEGKVVVMGRKSVLSYPGGNLQPGRTNIVLSHDKKTKIPGAMIVTDTEELLQELKKYKSEDIYIVGGESLYKQMLDYCDTIHVTKVDHEYSADAFFTNLDNCPEWKITGESEELTYFDVEYSFVRYERTI